MQGQMDNYNKDDRASSYAQIGTAKKEGTKQNIIALQNDFRTWNGR